MKKILLALVFALSVVTLAGCGGSTPTPAPPKATHP
jgi:predicted small lipoprotein YifL